MKKKIELGITYILIGISFITMLLSTIGFLDPRYKDTKLLSIHAFTGLVVSAFCAYKFPKINTIVMQEPTITPGKTGMINKYIRDPGSMFLYIAIGYFGIILWVKTANNMFDLGWLCGAFFIFSYFQGLITPFLGLKPE